MCYMHGLLLSKLHFGSHILTTFKIRLNCPVILVRHLRLDLAWVCCMDVAEEWGGLHVAANRLAMSLNRLRFVTLGPVSILWSQYLVRFFAMCRKAATVVKKQSAIVWNRNAKTPTHRKLTLDCFIQNTTNLTVFFCRLLDNPLRQRRSCMIQYHLENLYKYNRLCWVTPLRISWNSSCILPRRHPWPFPGEARILGASSAVNCKFHP